MEPRYTPERGADNFANTSSNRARQSHDRYYDDDEFFQGNHSEPSRNDSRTYGSEGELYDRDRRNYNHRRKKKSRRSQKR